MPKDGGRKPDNLSQDVDGEEYNAEERKRPRTRSVLRQEGEEVGQGGGYQFHDEDCDSVGPNSILQSEKNRNAGGAVKKIATFMYKGGVFKTTTTITAAAALSSKGYRVAIIDADGQCNATAFFCPPPSDWREEFENYLGNGPALYSESNQINPDSLPQTKVSDSNIQWPPADTSQVLTPIWFDCGTWLRDKETIYDALEPAFDQQAVRSPKLIPLEQHRYSGALYLLPGSTKIQLLESKLYAHNFDEYRPMYLAVKSLLDTIASENNLDFMFVDLGPNHHKMNMIFSFSCDYFLPPVHADFYSASSVHGLLHSVLPAWESQRKAFVDACKRREEDGEESAPAIFGSLPKLLPFLVQGYHLQGGSRARNAASVVKLTFANFIETIRMLVEDQSVSSKVRELYQSDSGAMVIPFCRALTHGIALSQQIGIPLPQIERLDMGNFYLDSSRQLSDGTFAPHPVHNPQYEKIMGDRTEALARYGDGTGTEETERSLANFLIKLKEVTNDQDSLTGSRGDSESAGPQTAVETAQQHPADGEQAEFHTEIDDPAPPRFSHLSIAPKVSNPAKKSYTAIAVFNYKGGVGKTTTVISLAASLANSKLNNRRVCIIDADGQHNATSFFHPDLPPGPVTDGVASTRGNSTGTLPSDTLPESLRPLPIEAFGSNSKWIPTRDKDNVHSAIKKCFGGRLDEIKCPSLVSVDTEFKGQKIFGGNLLLLPGSSQICNLSFVTSDVIRELRMYGMVRRLFDMMASDYDLDFIIVDLGPSIDDLTKAFVLSCDRLLPPVQPDYFSASSVRGLLNHVLPDWIRWRDSHRSKWAALPDAKREELKIKDGFYDFSGDFKILPFLVQGYTMETSAEGGGARRQSGSSAVSGGGGRQMERSASDFVCSITLLVQDKSVPDIVRRRYAPDGDGRMVVPFCQRLASAPTTSQRTGIPLSCLPAELLIDGLHGLDAVGHTRSATKDVAKAEVDVAATCFGKLAALLLEPDRAIADQPPLVPVGQAATAD